MRELEKRRILKEAKQVLKEHTPGYGTGLPQAEEMLSNLKEFPHHFVLGCLMDRQVLASVAWKIPYLIGEYIGSHQFVDLETIKPSQVANVLRRAKTHRFRSVMARVFCRGVVDIRKKYAGDASRIWADSPPSALVIRRFLEFDGVGIKIATMATNALVREFGVSMSDLSSIDISPDVQVMKFLKHQGYLRENAKREEAIYWAREMNPRYPGLLDLWAWRGGQALARGATRTQRVGVVNSTAYVP
jgi:hypothetical protein